MRLSTVKRVVYSLIGLMVGTLAYGYITASWLLFYGATSLELAASLLIWGIFFRCPFCRRHLGRLEYGGTFCKYCGHHL